MKHNVKEISLRKVENTIYVAEGDRSKCIEQLKNKFGLVLYADAETPETLAGCGDNRSGGFQYSYSAVQGYGR